MVVVVLAQGGPWLNHNRQVVHKINLDVYSDIETLREVAHPVRLPNLE